MRTVVKLSASGLEVLIVGDRIFVGPKEIAGYFYRLHKGFEKIGLRSDYVIFDKTSFNYSNFAKLPWLVDTGIKIKNRGRNHGKAKADLSRMQLLRMLPGLILIYTWGIYAVFKYDKFIFGFGQSLLPYNMDLPVIRALGKTSISVLGLGSESRAPYLNGALKSNNDGKMPSAGSLEKSTKRIKRLISRHERWSTHIVGYEGSSALLSSRRQLRIHRLGIPHALLEEKDLPQRDNTEIGSSLSILHAPSRKNVKGTSEIKTAVEKLIEEGFDLKFCILENVENKRVLQELCKADLLVDEIYSDTPMATLATEAASVGVPSIVGGFGLPEIHSKLPLEFRPPVITCEPESLLETLRKACSDREYLKEVGALAKSYAEKNLNPSLVASRYLSVLQNEVPDHWYFDPLSEFPVLSFGLTKRERAYCVSNMIEEVGLKSLGLTQESKRAELLLRLGLAKE